MNKVLMPKMGDTMEEGKVITWRKHEGDTVAKGDALAEIETEKVNIEAEVLDLRSIRPIDLDLIIDSVRKTNRVVVAEEGWKYYGTGQGIAALIYEHAFDYLDAPIGHVTGKDVPMPYAKPLEKAALPTHADVIAAVKATVPARKVAAGAK